ncbi:MAG: zinc ribbon domain-containing protein [Lysobacteraceae bacterium]
MPIYGFECASCGHRFDRLQRLSDPDPTVCPECGAEQLHRQLTAPAFRLSGSGWYETDFKKDGDKKRNLAESSSSSSGEGSASSESKPAEAKSETKSEAKSEAKTDAAPTPKSDLKPASKPASE